MENRVIIKKILLLLLWRDHDPPLQLCDYKPNIPQFSIQTFLFLTFRQIERMKSIERGISNCNIYRKVISINKRLFLIFTIPGISLVCGMSLYTYMFVKHMDANGYTFGYSFGFGWLSAILHFVSLIVSFVLMMIDHRRNDPYTQSFN